MEAIQRVKDSSNKTIGFILNDGSFYTDYFIAKNIDMIDNLKILNNGIIRSNRELPIISYKTISLRKYAKLSQRNIFKRDIQTTLLKWKNDPYHKVLQIEGARQIGKTTELLKFGYKNYEYVIYVNLGSDRYNFTETLKSGVNPLLMEKYCRNANLPHYVNSKKTLLIIDEIQINYEVYNSIRDLNSNLECDLIVTGSYLGQTLKKEYFQPAGTVKYIKMFPLSFSEFCKIFGAQNTLNSISLLGKDDFNTYDKLEKLYDVYYKIGGYPEVIKEFIQTKNVDAAIGKIADLLITFEKESRNYFTSAKDTMIFSTVYEVVFNEMCNERRGSGKDLVETITQLAKQSLKAQISRDEVNNAIQWLKYSGVIGDCDFYVDGNIKNKLHGRRLYFMDCGLANYAASITNNDDKVVSGVITETFVYSELNRICSLEYANRKVKESRPCFSTYGSYELDFMLVGVDNTVYGIEVKTTTGEPKSLKVYIDKGLVDRGVVAKRTKGGHGDKFDTIPIYTVGARFPYK